MGNKFLKLFSCSILVCLLFQTSCFAEPKLAKIALVIGNANYDDPSLMLDNPTNDSVAIAQKLDELGFQTHLLHNMNKASFESQFAVFIAELQALKTQNDNIIVTVFYAGHGIQLNRVNYLVPVDTQLMQQQKLANSDIEQQFISMQWVTEQLAKENNLLNIIILDACRDLPFSTLNSQVGGWTEIVKPNFFVAFGTGPGEQSLDGKINQNSVYVSAILSHIDSPDLNLSQLFQRVRLDVMQETDGFQVPQESNRSTYDFSFNKLDTQSSQFYFAFLIAIVSILVFGILLLSKLNGLSESKSSPTSKFKLASIPVLTLVIGGFILAQFDDSSDTVELYFSQLADSLNGKMSLVTPTAVVSDNTYLPKAPSEDDVVKSNAMATSADRGLTRVGKSDIENVTNTATLETSEIIPQSSNTNKQIVESILGSMIRLEGGQLELGSNQFGKEAKPVIVTFVEAFSLMSHEVTNKMYQLCIEANACTSDLDHGSSLDDLRPVVFVSYQQITEQFLPWLNGLSDIPFRLPTEVEWEYAAKLETDDPFNEKLLFGETEANCIDCFGRSFGRRTAPVKSYSPSKAGLYDLLGNVSEWTASCWTPDYQQQYYGDPWPNVSTCSSVVIRGGAWHQPMKSISRTGREKMAKNRKSGSIGFRLAM